jgi:predicted lipoprotein with Yx(FWY)xxD motif
VAQSKFGPILVDAKGMTLYLYDKDTATAPQCTAACLKGWPALTTTGTPTPGSGVTGKLTVLKRSDGIDQILIDGHPLYTFVGDSKPGDVNGQEVGHLWYAVTPAGEAAGDST